VNQAALRKHKKIVIFIKTFSFFASFSGSRFLFGAMKPEMVRVRVYAAMPPFFYA